jgi:thiamine pyrophosphate-dependent acetolactate synthase large subunit-like protein
VNILSDLGFDPQAARIPAPSFESIATAMGAQAATVRSVEDLSVVEDWLGTRSDTPLVLDCRVDPTIRGFTVTTQFKRPAQQD